jgi:hypothetical protein
MQCLSPLVDRRWRWRACSSSFTRPDDGVRRVEVSRGCAVGTVHGTEAVVSQPTAGRLVQRLRR